MTTSHQRPDPDQSDFALLYGPAARFSDHKIGETLEYQDAGQASGRNEGRILYVASANSAEPMRYIVSPDIGVFPVEVSANEVISN